MKNKCKALGWFAVLCTLAMVFWIPTAEANDGWQGRLLSFHSDAGTWKDGFVFCDVEILPPMQPYLRGQVPACTVIFANMHVVARDTDTGEVFLDEDVQATVHQAVRGKQVVTAYFYKTAVMEHKNIAFSGEVISLLTQ